MKKIAVPESGSGSINQRHESPDLDLHQNVMDPEHCYLVFGFGSRIRTTDLRIRTLLFSSVADEIPTKNEFFSKFFYLFFCYIFYITFFH
jgi:hypothetical protein